MAKETVLVLGLGEVGHPLFDLLKKSGRFNVYGFDVDEAKMRAVGQTEHELPSQVDVMHVCIPCRNQEEFAGTVANSAKQFKPNVIIINGTVPPKTTKLVHKRSNRLVAHSPIRGVHKNLEHMQWELERWTKYIGGVDPESAEAVRRHFEKLGLKTKVLKSSMDTELAKLLETTYRAWMVACFQEMHRISRAVGADFDGIVDFLGDTHRVRFDRPIMFPGIIMGRCVVPNAEMLLESCD